MFALTSGLRFASRHLLRRPAFAVVALATLALGLGATTAIFSLVYGVVLRPLDVPQPERVMAVFEDWTARDGVPDEVTSIATFRDWRDASPSFAALAASLNNDDDRIAMTFGGGAQPVVVHSVSREYFSALGIEPARGRGFLADEEVVGKDEVVVLSHGLWQRAFGGDPGVLGRQVTISSRPRTVVGVLPAGFRDPLSPNAEAWLPLSLEAGQDDRGGAYIRVVGRLRPQATPEQAQAELAAVTRGLAERFPERLKDIGVTVEPLQQVVVSDARGPALALFGAVMLVLLIACVNLANLLLARAAERQREMAVRSAIGAGRLRLTRQLMGESLLLAGAGGGLGLLVGWGLLNLLVRLAPPETPRLDEVALNGPVFLFALATTLVVGLLFGLLPAWRAAGGQVANDLRQGGRAVGSGSARLRRGLIVGEVALALALLGGAGLLGRTWLALGAVEPGFDTTRLLSVEVTFPLATYPEEDDLRARLEAIEERLRREPGVGTVGAASVLPLTGIFSDVTTRVEGMPELPPEQSTVQFQRVTPELFATLRIPLRAGRTFDGRDHADAGRTLIVNEAFAARYLKGAEPLGRRVRLGGADDAPWRAIVGVVASVHHGALSGEPEPQVYLPYAQAPSRRVQVVVRAAGEPAALVAAVKTALRQLDPEMAVLRVRTGDDIVGGQLAMPRFLVLLMGSFAALAMALALVGIYGVMAFLVSQRRREIGVRLALGAPPRAVLGLVVRQGLLLTSAGLAVGLVITLALARGLTGLLFGVEAADPWTLGGAAAAMLLAGLAACLGPALRAARVHPAITLRGD